MPLCHVAMSQITFCSQTRLSNSSRRFQATFKLQASPALLTRIFVCKNLTIHCLPNLLILDNNGCETSIAKSLYQIYAARQKAYLKFQLGQKTIEQVRKACYLGIWFEMGAKSESILAESLHSATP
jgi:hypothetical protein